MNTKLMVPALGVLLLSSSVGAFADEHFNGHREGPPAFHASNDRNGYRDARPFWHEHTRPVYVVPARRWCPPPSHAYWAPVLQLRAYYPGHWGQGPGYNRDGVTIIFRGHVN